MGKNQARIKNATKMRDNALFYWIPACAGMTVVGAGMTAAKAYHQAYLSPPDKGDLGGCAVRIDASLWIPAPRLRGNDGGWDGNDK